ncbi:hypothetical protein J2X06_002111 [Lysobacter niastensis]|uniref:Uncharacterized protein n=1 Tax=Lysobacter niastensis TaxID=380629 RepID=A0ABU1WBP7_9GAMM|nr:hypothetical protein [Lysobacter niastensis]MDR7134902.1 hypothetical protein [Lysobacter niastensis]
MSLRAWLALGMVIGVIGWWFSPSSPRAAPVPAHVAGTSIECRLPPLVSPGDSPRQTDVPASLAPFRLQAATLKPLAGFSVEARVLSREDYSVGREADLSPTDLALGWGRMRDDDVLSRLDISQGGRFYSYRWADQPPLPPPEIVRSSANMHLIPANEAAAEALRRVRKDDRVRIDGWLVEAEAGDGWRWRSSTTREDSGAGACEVIYVCSIERQ